jgi:hypothetical protein
LVYSPSMTRECRGCSPLLYPVSVLQAAPIRPISNHHQHNFNTTHHLTSHHHLRIVMQKRQTHSKSRRGCWQCKKGHVKVGKGIRITFLAHESLPLCSAMKPDHVYDASVVVMNATTLLSDTSASSIPNLRSSPKHYQRGRDLCRYPRYNTKTTICLEMPACMLYMRQTQFIPEDPTRDRQSIYLNSASSKHL